MKLSRPTNSPIYRRLVRRSFSARRALGALIPDVVSIRFRASLGLLALKQVDLGQLDLIRRATIGQLRDVAFLEHDLLPRLGLSGDAPETYPERLRGFAGVGLQHWQYPIQFARYLSHLSRYKIDSYLEIGVQHGGTFAITVEYLQRFTPLRLAVAVDLNRVPSLRRYAATNRVVEVMREDSSSARFQRFVKTHAPFGLVFIDGDHSEAGCRRDFETTRDHAALIALHDISDGAWPGVEAVWKHIRERETARFDWYEFVEQYHEVRARLRHDCLGIGLAVRKNAAVWQPERPASNVSPSPPRKIDI